MYFQATSRGKENTPASPHHDCKTQEATLYSWEHSECPSVRGTDHRHETDLIFNDGCKNDMRAMDMGIERRKDVNYEFALNGIFSET